MVAPPVTHPLTAKALEVMCGELKMTGVLVATKDKQGGNCQLHDQNQEAHAKTDVCQQERPIC